MEAGILVAENLKLSPLPAGFTVRPATLDDVPAAVEMYNICSMDQLGQKEHTVNETKTDWQTPGFSLDNDTRLVISPDGKIVGALEVWAVRKPPVKPYVWARVHPDFQRLGIGTYLTTFGEIRAREAIERCPEGTRVAMNSGIVSGHRPSQELLESMGMTLIRHFWDMEIELDAEPPEPQWPDGITITSFAEQKDLRAVFLAMQDSFQDHWGFVQQEEEEGLKQWQHWVDNDENLDPALWFLAMDGDEIAAISLCAPKANHNPDMGWVDVLGVRRPWRKRGLGLALLHHSFRAFYALGRTQGGLGVDASSLTGATRLYERAGMHAAQQFDSYEKELRPGKDITTQSLDS